METMVSVIDVVDEAEDQEQKVAELMQVTTEFEAHANALIITNQQEYQEAVDFGRALQNRMSEVKEFWKPIKEDANRAHKAICAKEKEMLAPLERAKKATANAVSGYQEMIARQKREAEEAARKAAQAEVDRKMREAAAMEAQGRRADAEMALEEATLIDETAVATAAVPEAPKAKGATIIKDWVIEQVDSTAVPVAFSGVELRPVDQAAVMRLIRASKGTISIPGIVYKEVTKASFRK